MINISDIPIKTPDEDKLGYISGGYIKSVCKFINESSTPLTIGIHGSWGVGKSSFLNLLEDHLTKEHSDSVKIVKFDSWAYSYEKEIWRAFLVKIITDIDPEYARESWKIETDTTKLIKYIMGGASHIGMAAATGGLSLPFTIGTTISKIFKNYEEVSDMIKFKEIEAKVELMRTVQDFRETFENLVKDKLEGKRLVVLVDDLDRCMPNETIEILTALKVFLNVKGCVYVIAADETAISRIIQKIYEIDGYDYLEKIIDLPFYIPLIADELADSFLETLVAKDEVDGARELNRLLLNSSNKNPRRLKRLVNTIRLSSYIAENQEALRPNFILISKLRCLSYTKKKIYNLLVNNPILFIILENYLNNVYPTDEVSDGEGSIITCKVFEFKENTPEKELADKMYKALNDLKRRIGNEYILVNHNEIIWEAADERSELNFEIKFVDDDLKLLFSAPCCFDEIGEDTLKKYIQLEKTVSESEKAQKEELDYTSAYCVKCKVKREMQNIEKITMKNGRPALKGICPECSTRMFRIPPLDNKDYIEEGD